jgi:heat shock protein HslJ
MGLPLEIPAMKRFMFPLALPLLFAACPACGSDPAVAPASTVSSSTNDVKSQLVRYHWRLQDATNKNGRRIKALFVLPDTPLQLDFRDGWYGIRNGCNDRGGRYALDGEFLTEWDGTQTPMLCSPDMMELDSEISTRFSGTMRFVLAFDGTPTLTLANVDGDGDGDGEKLVFVGTLIGERLTIEFAAHTKPCKTASTAETQCLQVRKVKYDDSDGSFDADGSFENLDGEIEGFEHEDGVRYVLGVERFAIEKPSAYGPPCRYVLEWTSVKDATGK